MCVIQNHFECSPFVVDLVVVVDVVVVVVTASPEQAPVMFCFAFGFVLHILHHYQGNSGSLVVRQCPHRGRDEDKLNRNKVQVLQVC